MSVEREVCPQCGGDCKLSVDLKSDTTLETEDRIMALAPMSCRVICTDCGLRREAVIIDFDVDMTTGLLEFGRFEYPPRS